MKIVTVLGARPQFIKAAVVSRLIGHGDAADVQELLIHTGQHFDANMSDVFFEELDIPKPARQLGIHSGSHGAMTGRMLEKIETVLQEERPDWVLVYGDTNSTLAGGLAAAKLGIRIAHVEAGLRSFNRSMAEEINRVLVDHVADALYCPTATSVSNLHNEGITRGVVQVGDVMLDASLYYRGRAADRSNILESLSLAAGGFILATCHRAENTDDPNRLEQIFSALQTLAAEQPVVLPLHPRTRNALKSNGLDAMLDTLTVVEPVPYLDMIALETGAATIVTDSGGVQKEAYFFEVPCVTMREETEWIETVEAGWNTLAGAEAGRIVAAASNAGRPAEWPTFYGNGQAGQKILADLKDRI